MLEAITAVIETLVIYLLMAAANYGWGRIAARLFRIEKTGSGAAILYIWLGWAVTLFLLQVANLWLPISAYVVIPLYLVGMIFTLLSARVGFTTAKKRISGYGMILSVVFLAVAVWVALRAMLAPTNYDSGLYHYNAIRWINSFPIVPGLGNLHGRLAFNQSFFTYVAALNFYPFFGHGSALANSFLFVLTFASIEHALRPVLRRPWLITEAHPFLYAAPLFVLPIVAFLTVYPRELSSPTPDLTSTLLQVNMFMLLARCIARWARQEEWNRLEVAVLAILAATAVTIKLSNLAVSAVCMGFCLVYTWRSSSARIKDLAGFFLPACAMVLVWAWRGVVLSGAPLYPSTLGYIPADWAVPVNAIIDQANSVYAWARLPHVPWQEVLGNWNWLRPWSVQAVKDTVGLVYPLISGLILGALALICTAITFAKKRSPLRWMEWSLLLFPWVGLIFWFFTAPDIRFANSLFWLSAVAAAILLLNAVQPLLSRRNFAVALWVVFLATHFLVMKYAAGSYSFKNVSLDGWQAEDSVPLLKNQTSAGLVIYSPARGDQCFDAPLPCTPDFNRELRLRVAGDLGAGFSVEKAR